MERKEKEERKERMHKYTKKKGWKDERKLVKKDRWMINSFKRAIFNF